MSSADEELIAEPEDGPLPYEIDTTNLPSRLAGGFGGKSGGNAAACVIIHMLYLGGREWEPFRPEDLQYAATSSGLEASLDELLASRMVVQEGSWLYVTLKFLAAVKAAPAV